MDLKLNLRTESHKETIGPKEIEIEIKIRTFVKEIDKNFVTIINYPEILDKSNIISSILTNPELIGTPVFLIVEDPIRISNNLGVPLPPDIFLSYEYDEKLQSILDIQCYIFIDDIIKFDQVFKKITKNISCHLIFIPRLINDKLIELINTNVKLIKGDDCKINMLYMNGNFCYPKINYQLETYEGSIDYKNILTSIIVSSDVKSLIYIPKTVDSFKTDELVEGLNFLNIPFVDISSEQAIMLVINSKELELIPSELNTDLSKQNNIGYIHIIDSIEYEVFLDIKRPIYTINNYNTKIINSINVIFHIDLNNKNNVDNYERISSLIKDDHDKYQSINDKCSDLIYKVNDGKLLYQVNEL